MGGQSVSPFRSVTLPFKSVNKSFLKSGACHNLREEEKEPKGGDIQPQDPTWVGGLLFQGCPWLQTSLTQQRAGWGSGGELTRTGGHTG